VTDEHTPGGGRLAGVPRSWLAVAAVVALALFGAGAGVGAVANSGADEQARLQAQLEQTREELAETSGELDEVRADRNRLSREQISVRSREQGLAGRQQELDQRQQELDGLAAALEQREADVGQAEETQRRNQIPGDGTFLVGDEIQPGRYRSAGGDGRPCYVARLSNLTGDDDIIDNELSEGPVVIDVRSSDEAVRTNGCQPFQRLG
jgi:TolA-binding protein